VKDSVTFGLLILISACLYAASLAPVIVQIVVCAACFAAILIITISRRG
jgi:hypothetical protein